MMGLCIGGKKMVTISKKTDKRYCKVCGGELVKTYCSIYLWIHKGTNIPECKNGKK